MTESESSSGELEHQATASEPASDVAKAPQKTEVKAPKKKNEATTSTKDTSSKPEADAESRAVTGQSSGEEDTSEEEEGEEEDEDEESSDEEEEEEEEEPRLKYVKLTKHLGAVYRNADAISTFMVTGDKMIVGTHNGNIHVVQLPMFQSQRVYHAHTASVTGTSVSPWPTPLPTEKAEAAQKLAVQEADKRPSSRQSDTPASPAAKSRQAKPAAQIPRIPSNDIYIATASMDGNVCVQSLIDLKDVSLRNFARPVQAVALSPNYRNDKTYLSGGLAGMLILTVIGGPGRSTSTTIGTAAATASGWLGSMGLSTNAGKDTILHSGEGTISCIKWSLSGKYVVWLNEYGIKIMRSHLHLDASDSEHAWKRLGHIDRPQTDEWETMAGVWKGRVEWIDEQAVPDDDTVQDLQVGADGTPATEKLKQQAIRGSKNRERLLVGWGGTIWIIHVLPATGVKGVKGNDDTEQFLGRAEIAKM